MSKIVKSQIFDTQNSAGPRECGADGIRRKGQYPLTILRHRFDDCEGLGRKLAIDIITLLVTGMLHIPEQDAIAIEIVPSQ